MIILGLTGSIGMGKSVTANMFRKLDIPVFDADQAVHNLYEPGGEAVAPVAEAFPGSISRENDGDRVDRNALGQIVLGDSVAIQKLETIVHPLVRAKQMKFLTDADARGNDIAVLDIPLLFETGGEDRVDKIVVVSAPADIQRDRVLSRPGMTEEKFNAILSRQLQDGEKRDRADYIVDSSRGFDDALAQVKQILADLRKGA